MSESLLLAHFIIALRQSSACFLDIRNGAVGVLENNDGERPDVTSFCIVCSTRGYSIEEVVSIGQLQSLLLSLEQHLTAFKFNKLPIQQSPAGLERELEPYSQSPWCVSAVSASILEAQCSNTNAIPHITLPYPKHNNRYRILTSRCKAYRCKTRKLITA